MTKASFLNVITSWEAVLLAVREEVWKLMSEGYLCDLTHSFLSIWTFSANIWWEILNIFSEGNMARNENNRNKLTRKLNPPQESDILLYSRNECPFNYALSSVFCYPPLAEISIGAIVCDRGAWVQPGRRRLSMASGCLLMDAMGMCVGCPPRIKGEFWKYTSVHLSASLAPTPYSPAVRHFHSVIAFRCIFIRKQEALK